MNLFNIGVTGKIELNPETIAIPPFKDIWDRDKSITKERATKEISYIVYLCDYRSPYIAYAEEYREGIIRDDFIKDPNWIPDEVIISAIAKYKDLQYTPILRMLHSALGVSDKISSYFDKVNFEETDSKGNLKYDINDVLAAIDKVQRAIKTLKSLERQVKTEQMDATSVRGNSEINEYEIPEE